MAVAVVLDNIAASTYVTLFLMLLLKLRIRRQKGSVKKKWQKRVDQEVREKDNILKHMYHDESKHKLLADAAGPSDTEAELESSSRFYPQQQANIQHRSVGQTYRGVYTGTRATFSRRSHFETQLDGFNNDLARFLGRCAIERIASDDPRLTSPELKIDSMTNCPQALRGAQDFDYDVIFIERELVLGDMTGLEFSWLLRQSKLKRRVKANIMATTTTILCGFTDDTSRPAAYKASGMDGLAAAVARKLGSTNATVDRALLLHLMDDDLRNTLGMEHRLHRNKC
ncbi:hypothetical protein F442_02405 [Phytophthora nicotianae P10297]|uniref:Uncharacterized protein n=1 Tax=Phytophthora nicotianae P10297 TaxID=1317064 RepID=W3A091_PHYNI|nr:hypothetical protein F442_02405 [Phytophthora nicotianae P10297]